MPEEDTEQKILRNLALSALRSHVLPQPEFANERLDLGLYDVRYCSEIQREQFDAIMRLEAKALTRSPSVIMRALELTVDGIVPCIISDGDRGFVCVRVFVDFSPRGRRVLEGKAIAFSEIVRSIRRTLLAGYWTLALFLVPIALWDKIDRQGLIAAFAAIAAIVVVQYFWTRIFRRSV